MAFIIEPAYVEEETTILKVSWKGNIWERRENNKLINWFMYENSLTITKTFVYQYGKSTNKWYKYMSSADAPEVIEIPFIEKRYLNEISIKKLYKFDLKHYYGIIEGLFVSTEVEVKNLIGSTIYLGEVAGKHSNVTTVLSWEHLIELNVSQSTVEDLLNANHREANICGINPFDCLEEF